MCCVVCACACVCIYACVYYIHVCMRDNGINFGFVITGLFTDLSTLSTSTSSPEWIPILSWSFVSGMCRIVKDRMAESRWRDMEAI